MLHWIEWNCTAAFLWLVYKKELKGKNVFKYEKLTLSGGKKFIWYSDLIHGLKCYLFGNPKAPRPNNCNMPINATYCNAVLRAFGHRVATCCDMLDVVGWSLKMVKFEPTTPNMSQHVATGWPNASSMLRPTMLQYDALVCCDRLAGA